MIADLGKPGGRAIEVFLRSFEGFVDRDAPLTEVIIVDRLNRVGPVVS